MKKFLVITSVASMVDQFLMPTIRMLQDMNYEVHVACNFEKGSTCSNERIQELKQSLDELKIKYFQIDFARNVTEIKGNLVAYKQVVSLIKENQYDLVHCHSPIGGLVTRLACIKARKNGTKVLYTAHGFHFFKGAPIINWLAFYPAEWLLAPFTDVLITINKEDYAFAQRNLKANRTEYVPGVGIKTEKFRTPLDAAEKRRSLGFGDQDFLILTVAEMNKNKNQAMVLKAMALLKGTEAFSNMKYLICGMGDYEAELRRQAKELGIEDHVFFLGYRKDIPQIHRASDLFAFLSYREGLPVALMEAMCSGMPTVCSAARGNTDLIENGKEGLIVDNEPRALADAILTLYHEPDTRRRYGQAAARKVQQFDRVNVHRIMKDIYLSL